MSHFIVLIKLEMLKILGTRSFWIVCGLVVIFQPILAIISGKELVRIGLEATPLTHPELAQALPPLDYLGFNDIIPFGLIPIVVLGSLIGVSEYRNHLLRTTLLSCNNRQTVFIGKMIALLLVGIFISVLSIYLSIAATHAALGDLGLGPIRLSSVSWQFIFYASSEWVLLILLSFGMGMVSRSVILPLLFLIPQIYGLASFLTSITELGKYLPASAGQLMTATPTDALLHDPRKGGLILGIWTISFLAIAMYTFVCQDVGGRKNG